MRICDVCMAKLENKKVYHIEIRGFSFDGRMLRDNDRDIEVCEECLNKFIRMFDCGDMSDLPDTLAEDNDTIDTIGSSLWATGNPDLKPRTIVIDTDNIIIRNKSFGFEISLSNEALEEADEIIINGYVFKKVKEN